MNIFGKATVPQRFVVEGGRGEIRLLRLKIIVFYFHIDLGSCLLIEDG